MDNLRVRTASVPATLLLFMLRMTPDEAEIVLASCQVLFRQGQARLQQLGRRDLSRQFETR